MEENKKPNLRGPILSLLFAVIFAGIGIFAYLNDYIIVLFRIIPLNAIAFGIIALVLFVLAIVSLIRALSARKGQ